jgi:hypothetical protein
VFERECLMALASSIYEHPGRLDRIVRFIEMCWKQWGPDQSRPLGSSASRAKPYRHNGKQKPKWLGRSGRPVKQLFCNQQVVGSNPSAGSLGYQRLTRFEPWGWFVWDAQAWVNIPEGHHLSPVEIGSNIVWFANRGVDVEYLRVANSDQEMLLIHIPEQ